MSQFPSRAILLSIASVALASCDAFMGPSLYDAEYHLVAVDGRSMPDSVLHGFGGSIWHSGSIEIGPSGTGLLRIDVETFNDTPPYQVRRETVANVRVFESFGRTYLQRWCFRFEDEVPPECASELDEIDEIDGRAVDEFELTLGAIELRFERKTIR